MLVTITPNSRIDPSFRLVSETAPGLKTVSVQVASSPSMRRNRAGMLVMNVPMKNQPKMRPVRRTSTVISSVASAGPLGRHQHRYLAVRRANLRHGLGNDTTFDACEPAPAVIDRRIATSMGYCRGGAGVG